VGARGVQGYALLGEGLVEQPCYYGEVAAFIVCGEQDGVFVLLLRDRSHGCGGQLVRERQ
jgi:hypothetical protein